MRNISWFAISIATAFGNLIGCVGDDTAGTASGGRAGAGGATTSTTATSTTTRATTTATTSTTTSTTSTTGSGGMAGSGGGAGSAGTGGMAGGGNGGAAGSGEPPDGGQADVEQPDSSDAPIGEPCVAETDAVLCARFSKNCGVFKALDNCGLSHSASCGICATMGDTSACGSSGTINVCSGGTPINRAHGGFVDSTNPADVAVEDMTKAFDANVTTKWIALNVTTAWIRYQFAGGATYAINSYTITSANDFPGRDPMDWRLEGSMDGVNWTAVDTRTGQTFADRFLTNQYTFTNTTAYPVYRFFVVANSGDPSGTQLAEIQLFGPPGPISDAAIGGGSEAGRDGAADAVGQ
jgi:hypothetical protein